MYNYNYYYILLETEVRYFGVPRYFFRGTLTSAIVTTPMVCVQWIPFILDQHNRTTSHGRITVDNWNAWPLRNTITLNPYISTKTLLPSRFALGFVPPTRLSVYVDVAFIALDAENLCEENQDQYTHDFGDNKFPYYKGNTSVRLTDELIDDDNEINQEAEIEINKVIMLKEYIPPSVLRLLMTKKPRRLDVEL